MSILSIDSIQFSKQVARPDRSWTNAVFSEYVRRERPAMVEKRVRFPFWLSIKNCVAIPGGCEFWHGSEEATYYLKIFGPPGTIAGDILRCERDLPTEYSDVDREIIGDIVRKTSRKEPPPDEDHDPDLEDCSEEVAKLPLIDCDPNIHFSKTPTYKQEIRNLLLLRGSPRIVQLLGRTKDGALVFQKYRHDLSYTVSANRDERRVENIKRWMIEVIDAVEVLHSHGIVHRDLVVRNILEAEPLVICDLQCLNATGHCRAPELDGIGQSMFSFASDIFSLGTLLWECCFYNYPTNRQVLLDNPPPPPFRDIFLACTQEMSEDRPTLSQLREMYVAV
ncbi:kinase-like protein [Rickenella mellea]|uniref:Kinase-like protein n=1 Tax=Rickenella mellea TaxID=50990 RepID=A0A4R5XFP7_9AGAM|nr:kinase-like protein [Rickenella mellea]